MALSSEMTAILDQAELTCPVFKKFLEDKNMKTPDRFGLVAATEAALEDRFFPVLKAAGIKIEELDIMISVKKAWLLSRGQVDKDANMASGRIPQNAYNDPLPTGTRLGLTEAWKKNQGFVLSNDRLLSEALVGQLFRELTASPKRMSILTAESLRLQSAIQGTGKQIATFTDGVIGAEEIIADQVTNNLELYMKMKAYFNTVALVTVNIPDFFSYQDVVFIEDKLLNLLQFTKENRRPPVVFWTTAWATTMQTWSDEIRTTGKSLSLLTKETATWTPPWLSWNPTPGFSGSSPDAGTVLATGAGSSKERELQRELDFSRRWASQMQSERDRAVANRGSHKRTRSPSPQQQQQHQRQGGGGGGGRHHQGASSKAKGGGKGGKGGKQWKRR